MRTYIIKRILLSVLILFSVTLIIYAVLPCLPASYVESMAMQLATAPGAKPYEEWIEQLNASYGLDKGIIAGYFTWLGDFARGNFGDSWKFTVPVVEKFHDVVWLSFVMAAISFTLQILIAIPLGIIAATKQYSRTDYVITAGALLGISLPPFFFATLLKLVFAVNLQWFDVSGLVGRTYAQLDSWGQFMDKAHHLVLPIATLVITSIGPLMRYTRTNMLEVLNADYIRTARAKGLKESKVIYKHAFRNTLIPIVTGLAGLIPSLFSGAMITEQVFDLPGIGHYALSAMQQGDIPVIMTYNMFLAFLSVLGVLLSDLMYGLVDPRVKLTA